MTSLDFLPTCFTQIDVRVGEMRQAQHREWMARIVQRSYRAYRQRTKFRKAYRDLATKQRNKQVVIKGHVRADSVCVCVMCERV